MKILRRFRSEFAGFGIRITYTVFAFLISIMLARLLGPAGLGIYYEVVAWVLLIGTIVQSGWNSFLVREVAALREGGRFAELLGLSRFAVRLVTLISIAACLLLLAGSHLFGDRETFDLFLVGAPALVLLSTSSVRQSITRGLGNPLRGSIGDNLLRPGSQLIGLALFAFGSISAGLTPFAAMAILSIATCISAMAAYVLEQRALRRIPQTHLSRLPPTSEWMAPLVRTAILGWTSALSLQIGTITLGLMGTSIEVANFRVAQQLSILLALGLTVVALLYAKDFSRLHVRGDTEGIQRLAAKGALISGGAALPLGAVFIIAGVPLINFLYGPGFTAAALPLAIMSIGQLVNNLFGPVTSVALGTRNEAAALHAHVISSIGNVVLCLALVPSWGAVGAAIAYAAGLLVWNSILFVFLKRRVGVTCFAGVALFRPSKTETAE